MAELERAQFQIKNLKEQMRVLREKHEYTVLQLMQSRQNQQKLKKLNDTLAKTIQDNTINFDKLNDINIVIEGELTSKRIAQLERELQNYRQGVNASVDRRVREIVRDYSDLEEEDKSKSRLSLGDRNNVSINYNLVKNQRSIGEGCQKCLQLQADICQKDKLIEQMIVELQQLRADRDIYSSKLHKVEALTDTLKKQNKLLKGEISKLQQQTQQIRSKQEWANTDRSYYEDRGASRISYGRVAPTDYKEKGKENMIKEITSIVNVFSNRKQGEERGRSRVMPAQDSNALFSIKNGINRPNAIYY